MVRLEASPDWQKDDHHACFNSSMVRLEERSLCQSRSGGQFQFQYGTIGREKGLHITIHYYKFQFQYGTIGRTKNKETRILMKSFQFQYGTIGRLSVVVCALLKDQFQFQYGTIGSTRRAGGKGPDRVSIPVWYDWKADIEQLQVQSEVVSIPVWYDWKSLTNDIHRL